MQGLFIAQSVIRLNEVNSTNEYAALLLKTTAPPEGTVIIANSQLAGKGQRGKHWFSEPGKNITMSLILYPSFLTPSEQFILNKGIALGIASFVKEKTQKDVCIKWPNDIYVYDKKIAGILIENNIKQNRLQSSIVGIGLNVNQVVFHSSIINATSLKLETNIDYNIENCMQELCSHIEAYYLDIRAMNKEKINERYNNLLYNKNKIQLFTDEKGADFTGEILEVDEKGQLKVKTEKGIRCFSNSEITMVITQK